MTKKNIAKILEKHALFLDFGGEDSRGERADLRGADLRGVDLRGAHLGGADLRGVDLGGANLRGAALKEADLRGANLGEADLREAYLRGANLSGADLREADLRGADLSGADLSGATYDIFIFSVQWGEISSDSLTTECMCWDASLQPPTIAKNFLVWGGGGGCPLERLSRAIHFRERRDLFEPRPPKMTLWELFLALMDDANIKHDLQEKTASNPAGEE